MEHSLPADNLKENLGLSLLDDGVAATNLTDATVDTAEAFLDGLTAMGDVMEAFPVFGTLVKLIRTGFSIHDRLFMQKMATFLLELKNVSVDERYRFVRDMDGDPAFKKKVGAKLILLLDRVDDLEKASVLGKLFRAYLVGRADYVLFGRLASIVDRAYLPDLAQLQRRDDEVSGDDAVIALESLGLMYQSGIDGGNFMGESDHKYRVSDLGKQLVTLIF
ncbi:hypothetical protein LRS06_21960 [Hymenobacter sp. J193]|uniref:hypothetical protein n=1 Tax=Hymenobacter sp. J193 TaxID=2898429 RepID=UPI002151341F|nr:hypothetical protein [Hymenobacter sp. J193]MCR5890397.1 hypothetical protein [Hymenobacter sp. J193]